MCDDGSAQAPGLANAHDSNDSRAGVFVCAPGVAGVSVQPARDPNHVDLITGYAFIITVDGESGTPLPDQCEIKLITHGQGGPSATPTGCN